MMSNTRKNKNNQANNDNYNDNLDLWETTSAGSTTKTTLVPVATKSLPDFLSLVVLLFLGSTLYLILCTLRYGFMWNWYLRSLNLHLVQYLIYMNSPLPQQNICQWSPPHIQGSVPPPFCICHLAKNKLLYYRRFPIVLHQHVLLADVSEYKN